MFQIEALDHVALIVQDLQQSINWYQSVLGMEKRSQYKATPGHENPVVVGSGDACIALFPSSPDYPVATFKGHIAMRLKRVNFEQAQEHLRHNSIEFGFVRYPTCDSIYFDDLDGYQIELSTYEMK